MGQEVKVPQEAPNPAGGVGEPSDRAKRWEQRQHLRVLEAAVYKGYDIPPDHYATIPRDLRSIAQDEHASPRDRIRALEALVFLEQKQVDRAIELDKILRLDAGAATENVAFVDLPEAALKAVADTIRARRCPAKPRKR